MWCYKRVHLCPVISKCKQWSTINAVEEIILDRILHDFDILMGMRVVLIDLYTEFSAFNNNCEINGFN